MNAYRVFLAITGVGVALAVAQPAAATGTWQTRAPLPEPAAGGSVASVGGTLYMVGGTRIGGDQTDAVLAYDPEADAWSTVGRYPGGAVTPALARSGDALYAFGGAHVDTSTTVRGVYRFEPEGGTWERVSREPRTRWGGFATAGPRGTIWLSGGLNLATNEPWHAVDVYNPATNRWSKRIRLPDSFPRQGHSRPSGMVMSRKGRMYAFEGTHMYRFQPHRGWRFVGIVPPPHSGDYWISGSSVVRGSDGRFYIVGGYTHSGSLAVADNETMIYTPRTGQWRVGPPLGGVGGEPSVARVRNMIIAAGGIDDFGGTLVTDVHALDTSS